LNFAIFTCEIIASITERIMPQILKTLLPLTLVVMAVLPAAAAENRCGWVANPTPGNWMLFDADGRWTMSAQGGYQAPGMDKLPEWPEAEWVKTNGYYGYGCGCLSVTANAAVERISAIRSASVRPLSACQNDPALPSMDE
jgi:hypothetical protein